MEQAINAIRNLDPNSAGSAPEGTPGRTYIYYSQETAKANKVSVRLLQMMWISLPFVALTLILIGLSSKYGTNGRNIYFVIGMVISLIIFYFVIPPFFAKAALPLFTAYVRESDGSLWEVIVSPKEHYTSRYSNARNNTNRQQAFAAVSNPDMLDTFIAQAQNGSFEKSKFWKKPKVTKLAGLSVEDEAPKFWVIKYTDESGKEITKKIKKAYDGLFE